MTGREELPLVRISSDLHRPLIRDRTKNDKNATWRCQNRISLGVRSQIFLLLLFAFSADYNAGTPAWYGLTCFTVMVLALSFVFAWMRLKSRSVWTAALLHASHNLYVQSIFTPLTHQSGSSAWFIDEFGVVLPVVTVAFAIFFWAKGGELAAIVRQPVQEAGGALCAP